MPRHMARREADAAELMQQSGPQPWSPTNVSNCPRSGGNGPAYGITIWTCALDGTKEDWLALSDHVSGCCDRATTGFEGLAMGRIRRCLVTLAIVLIALIGVPAVALAGPPPPHYAALGDSYSAGVGSQVATNECGRSPLSYPALYKTQEGIPDANFNFVACGGATTGTVRHDQLGALSKQTDLVTITIGGNDIGFSPLLTACSLPGPDDTDCNVQIARSEALSVFVLPALLASTYHGIHQQAPHAMVVVLGLSALVRAYVRCGLRRSVRAEFGPPNQAQSRRRHP